ncbi:MAG: NAD(P)-dependent glycerol-3-phosphate dehydrogenase [Candidatus Omnitrophica bacterium]|nr:NAD(P)-dependent glycerol-3-phosphate dehydrogenase [Candidatus Omnitrophota bacterium]
MSRSGIAILGDGGWGTTLALLLHKKKFSLTLWSAFKDYSRYLDRARVNKKFLPGIKIPRGISITDDLQAAVSGKDLIVLAVPAQYIRSVLKRIKPGDHLRDASFLSVSKGIEVGTLRRVSQIVHEELGNVRLAVLSGPTIAHEVALGIPTTAVIAAADPCLRRHLQGVFMAERFRVYTNEDVVGVELGGSLKNVIAIACGISDGLKFGTNAKAAILSRGLVEISRLGHAMGAKVSTFYGISGLGDLVTTCISPYSRNRFVGEQVGRGKALKEVQLHMQMVAEGIPTTKSAYSLSLKYKVDMPITREVYQVLYKNKPPLKAVKDLMTREGKEE